MASMAKYWATDLENKVAGDCLDWTGLDCTALHCTALHCTALVAGPICRACSSLNRDTSLCGLPAPLHCTALHCTALHCTALHCTELHCTRHLSCLCSSQPAQVAV
jgi:hypothetical protein